MKTSHYRINIRDGKNNLGDLGELEGDGAPWEFSTLADATRQARKLEQDGEYAGLKCTAYAFEEEASEGTDED